jgi:hypothetical protein
MPTLCSSRPRPRHRPSQHALIGYEGTYRRAQCEPACQIPADGSLHRDHVRHDASWFMTVHRRTEPMTEAQHSGDVEGAQVCNLAAAASTLLERAAAAPAGRAALTLVRAPLKQTLLALRGGVHLAEHDAPEAATLQILQGRVRLVQARRAWSWVRATTCRSRPLGTGWRAWGTLPSS